MAVERSESAAAGFDDSPSRARSACMVRASSSSRSMLGSGDQS
jgi:hypothetical protein